MPAAPGGVLGVMPGASEQTFGAKLISVFPGNFAKGIQSHQGGVLLFDPDTGAPVAFIHAGEVTAIRTAAATAAATDVLARNESSRLALLGYGEQALTHARAMAHVRTLSEISIWGRSPEKAGVLADRLRTELGVATRVALTPAEAVAGADIVCAVSAAQEPILNGADVAPGTHVNLVGSSSAVPREADDDLVVKARIFADHREGVLKQGGEVIHAIEAGLITEAHVLGEIGQVMNGDLVGRIGPSDVTAYKSLGAVVQDLYAGWYVYAEAVKRGLGTEAAF
jgi:ornithine cyclodeaminase